ncbi:Transposon Ty3-I Gag-Pol polyprotein [Araneus ventricosus]|uniref:Transposon Ty3-I Gag-Pol polyprotein n=1 Tax=Araneus ventricosus TaxID=182803 RepID=A0A4Y2RJ99_ARAVE|nr:Transposon Ty3-I Gag-Pol polyprotein [Araneus ventricosus]
MADKICDMSPKTEIYSASYEHNYSNELLDRVKNLEQQISALCIRTGARPRTRNNNYFRNRSRSRSNWRHDFNPKGKLCYFHFRFGTKCFPEKCQPTCSWNQKPQENQENSSLQPNLFPKEIKHDVKHFIETNGQPIHTKARQLDPNRLVIAKEEFTLMLNYKIIRPSNSQWSSPLHLETKKDGSYRPCGDYRQLNAQTIPDRYPIPRLEDFYQILKQTKIFSKIDLFKAYFQIPIAEEHKCKTAIITPFGLYEFNITSCGLKMLLQHSNDLSMKFSED